MNLKDNGLVLLGAVSGGLLGYLGFFWLVHQGFYGLILPGGLLGIGAGVFKAPSKYIAVICGSWRWPSGSSRNGVSRRLSPMRALDISFPTFTNSGR